MMVTCLLFTGWQLRAAAEIDWKMDENNKDEPPAANQPPCSWVVRDDHWITSNQTEERCIFFATNLSDWEVGYNSGKFFKLLFWQQKFERFFPAI